MFKQSNGVFLFVLGLFFLFSCGNKNKTSEYHLRKALYFEEENNYEKCLDELNVAIRLDPRKSNLYAFRGKIFIFLENDSLALLDLDKAINLNPRNISAYYYKGISLTYFKNYTSAIESFNKAISLKTKGEIIFDIKPSDFEDFGKKVDIEISAIRFNRGITFFESNQYNLALDDFYAAKAALFNEALCNYYIGVIYIKQNDSAKGCLFIKKAIQAGRVEAEDYFSKFCK